MGEFDKLSDDELIEALEKLHEYFQRNPVSPNAQLSERRRSRLGKYARLRLEALHRIEVYAARFGVDDIYNL